jgi:GDP-L-fucose synthase
MKAQLCGKEDLEICVKNKKTVLVTGGTGLVGSALKEVSLSYPEFEFRFIKKKEHNLCIDSDVEVMFEKVKPDYVIHAAARTGGLKRNLLTPADQYYDNILMNSHMVHYSFLHKVKKLLALSSVACYDPSLNILTEDKLQFGYPHSSFKSYGYTKRMLDIQIEAYNKQYGTAFTSIICSNIFGKHDGFNLEYGHVVPSLIHKCYLAKKKDAPLEVWGDGTPRREFIYAKDLAVICLDLLVKQATLPQRIIVSGKEPVTIKSLVGEICHLFGFKKIKWIKKGPSSNQERITEKKMLQTLLPYHINTPLSDSLGETIEWFLQSYPNIRI